jgi:AcrR family transcriptional regulator
MPERSSPQQLRAKRTRRHLLAAAQRVFARDGYPGATVDDIARAAGCSKGAYYFHFASKEDVLLALVDDWTRGRSQRLAEAATVRRLPDAALIDLLEALFSPAATDGWEQRLLLEFWSQGERNPRVRRRLAQAHRSWRRLLVQAFSQAQEAGVFASDVAAEAAAEVALALHHGLLVQACLQAPAGASARGRASAALALLAGPRALRRAG